MRATVSHKPQLGSVLFWISFPTLNSKLISPGNKASITWSRIIIKQEIELWLWLVVANVSVDIIVDSRQMSCPTPLLQADLCRNSPVSSRQSKICAKGCGAMAVKLIHMILEGHYEYNVIAGGVMSAIHACDRNRGRGWSGWWTWYWRKNLPLAFRHQWCFILFLWLSTEIHVVISPPQWTILGRCLGI